MYNKTLLIAIEGKDFLGKSCQSVRLAQKIENSIYQKIPSKDGITYEKIYNMLKSGNAVLEPYYFQCLQATNREFWQQTRLPVLASEYEFIILDRWNLSTLVYGTASGIPLKNCEIMIDGIIEPDICFVFDGTAFDSDRKKDSYEKDNELQNNVADLYLKFAKEKKNCIIINANRDMEIITEELYNYCMKLKERK